VPDATCTGATVGIGPPQESEYAGPIRRRFGSSESRRETDVPHKNGVTFDWLSVEEAHPSEFGWGIGGLPDGSTTPIQNAFGWGMGSDGDGWTASASRDDASWSIRYIEGYTYYCVVTWVAWCLS